MDGHKQYLTDLIEGKLTRFVIPVYQRNYDWKQEQCGRLFDDLVEVVKTDRDEHFFGSIVSQTPRGERVVIDGQQRITTVFLLLAAIRSQLSAGVVAAEDAELADDIDEYYLIDRKHRNDQKLRLKLIKSDRKAFAAILDEKEAGFVPDSNVTQNFLYFKERIASADVEVDDLYEAIKSLCVIDITLDPGDDAQLIFESLNSTGLSSPGGSGLEIETEELLKEMLRYSIHYRNCIHPETGSKEIDSALRAIRLFDASVIHPYLLNLLEYRKQGNISDDAVAEVLWAIDSYLFRRWVCGVPANALNKIFETLHSDGLKGVDEGFG